MTDALRWLGALLPLLLLGFGLVLLLAARENRIDAARALGWSILLGAFGLSLLEFACAFAVRGRPLRLTLVVVSLAVAAAGLARARRHGVLPSWSPPRGRGEWLLLGGVLLELVLVAFVIYRTTSSWDGFVTLEARARPAWLAGGLASPDAYADAHRWFARPDPWPFVPTLEAWVLGWLGTADQRVPKALGLVLFVAALCLLWSAAREDRRWMLAPLLPLAVPQIVVGPGSASSGEGAFPLAVFYLACVLWLAGPDRGGGWRVLPALAAALVWIQPDGILLWVAVVALGAWSARGNRLGTAARIAAPGLALLIAWSAFLFRVGAAPATPAPAPTAADLLDLGRWGLLWPVLLLCAPPLLPPELRSVQRRLLAVIVVPLALWSLVVLLGVGAWIAPAPGVLAALALPALLALSAAGWAFARARIAAAPSVRAGAVTAGALLAAFALPGLEHTARGFADAPRAAPGAAATTDTLLAPLGIPSPTVAVRGHIDASDPPGAVMFVGTGREAREVGTVIALLGHPRPFGGWACPDARTPPRPLPASVAGPESDGVLFVYRARGGPEEWLPGHVSANLAMVSASERYLVPPPPSLCRPVMALTRGQAALLVSRRVHAGGPPPPARGMFRDVEGELAAAVEELHRTGAVSGCEPSLFCPDRVITRAHMALFALAAAGRLADLPPATGIFADVPRDHPLARHVERALLLGVPGCADDPPRFCPDRPPREEELAPFLEIVRPSAPPR
jgi:hypothetical protein